MAHGPVYFGLKAVGPYTDPLFFYNGKIFEELLSLHMNLCQKVVVYDIRASIWALKNDMGHGSIYLVQ